MSDDSLYESVESALSLMDCDIGPAECHGMLCGMLCGMSGFEPSIWLDHLGGYQDDVHIEDLGSGHALTELLAHTFEGFDSEDFSLTVLLPDEDAPLENRAEELGAWSRGFLSGFGLGDLKDLEGLSDDARAYLRDLTEIGRIDVESARDQSDEFALVEVSEYARMGALLLREEVQIATNTVAADVDDTIH